ncbi:serine/threonine protein kinase [Sphaeroforma arctica JP610]|uniref:Serine/threonine protein kinase n=1 Tax=Sphaeroforma arctica JP610 TaxID=667725 RepID=A0A0L0FVR4_9EUKA|nr:serine/threonine protein kinase [Sphaeroforma arctica JP610]KNC80729.1 serine/threonine protein kinase [Sphaeroforma arctica JP610]|eukprot:XP_014154631.1 serine/threonine protein kinase [Sphaeroforma arctica JP610]
MRIHDRSDPNDSLYVSDSDYCESCDSPIPDPLAHALRIAKAENAISLDTPSNKSPDNYDNGAKSLETMSNDHALRPRSRARSIAHQPHTDSANRDISKISREGNITVGTDTKIAAHESVDDTDDNATDWSVFWVPTTKDILAIRDHAGAGMVSEPYLRTLRQVAKSSRKFAEQFRPYIGCVFDETTGMPISGKHTLDTGELDGRGCDGYVYFTTDSKPVKKVKENGNVLVVVRGLLGDEKVTLTVCRLTGNRMYPDIMEMDGVRGSWGVNVLASTYACPEDIEVLQALLVEDNKCFPLKPVLYPAECRARLIESMATATEGLSPVRAFLKIHGLASHVNVLGQDEMERTQGDMVGDGTFGAVYRLNDSPNHVLKMFKTECNAEDRLNEIMCLGALQGVESVPKLFAVVEAQFDGDKDTDIEEGLHFIGYVCTRYDYTLLDYHKENPNAADVYSLITGLVISLRDIHRQRICHLDLCDRNVMVTRPPAHKPGTTSKLEVSIIDFAGACLLPESMLFLPNPLIAKCTYRPPEIFKARNIKAGEKTGILPFTQAHPVSAPRNRSMQANGSSPANDSSKKNLSAPQTRRQSQSPTRSRSQSQNKEPVAAVDNVAESKKCGVSGSSKTWVGYVEITDESSSESEESTDEKKSNKQRLVDGRKLDVWGLGVIFTEILTRGIKAWGGTFDATRLNQIVSSEKAIKRYIEESVEGSTWRELLGSCLAVKPSRRWLCDEILDYMKENRDNLMEELKGLPVKSGARTKKSRQLDKYQDTSMLNPKPRKLAKQEPVGRSTRRRGNDPNNHPEKSSKPTMRTIKSPGSATGGRIYPLPVPLTCLEPEHYMIIRKLSKPRYTDNRIQISEEHIIGSNGPVGVDRNLNGGDGGPWKPARGRAREHKQTVNYERLHDPVPRAGRLEQPAQSEAYNDMTSEEDEEMVDAGGDEDERRRSFQLLKHIAQWKAAKAEKRARSTQLGSDAEGGGSATLQENKASHNTYKITSTIGTRANEKPAPLADNGVPVSLPPPAAPLVLPSNWQCARSSKNPHTNTNQLLENTNFPVRDVLGQNRLDMHNHAPMNDHYSQARKQPVVDPDMPPMRQVKGRTIGQNHSDSDSQNINQNRRDAAIHSTPLLGQQAYLNPTRQTVVVDYKSTKTEPTKKIMHGYSSTQTEPTETVLGVYKSVNGYRKSPAQPVTQTSSSVAALTQNSQACVYSGTIVRPPAHKPTSVPQQPYSHVSKVTHKGELMQRPPTSQPSTGHPPPQPHVMSAPSIHTYGIIPTQFNRSATQIRNSVNTHIQRYQQQGLPRTGHPHGPAEGTG